MAPNNLELKHALINGFRRELDKRYRLGAIREYEAFDVVSDENVEALRRFFLDHIYPPAKAREKLDEASNRVMDIFHSPRRLLPLAGSALGAMFRFAGMMREAAQVTRTTLEAFRETRHLEEFMMRYAKKAGIEPEELKKSAVIRDVILQIPEKEMLRFRRDVITLFRSLANVDLMKAGIEIMDGALVTMRKKPGVYDTGDIEGFEYGRDLLQSSVDLYSNLSEEEALAVIDGIEAIEEDWYEAIKDAGAARQH